MENAISTGPGLQTSHLPALAIKGLESMYDAGQGLFCYRLRKTPDGLVREGISHRYTIMTLLGLLRAEFAGLQSRINVEAAIDRLFDSVQWVDNIGDLGLLLWLCASSSQKRLGQFYTTFDLWRALENCADARRRLTMEMSWFLTGLVQAAKTELSSREELANKTYKLLRANQGKHGLFGHMAIWHSVAGVVRGRVGSFADQVYPIFAMAHFSQAFGNSEARDNALRCANAICRLQGPLGQWWWHYDSGTGRVVEHYPVYSVHQHGMAPMALLALEETCGTDFREPINHGLKWINGANELKQDLEDAEIGVAWRCIRPGKSSAVTAGICALAGKTSTGSLRTLYECRPYELGWLLYALAPVNSVAMQG